ncbi:ABC transporter permease [Oscillochloris sp. ZM17-4]|uniref:ABC transporter permease subunit n=1 Tax=Oscillochloris sp. ZM17-4 TaxID=2866714 RepID=UPI001C736FA8|nr:ABC transporter permease [Oscillochloris sp. ZM17-4]MBX0327260.1 ABC transporter permease [Oscillochloris sp. ZM17-4]
MSGESPARTLAREAMLLLITLAAGVALVAAIVFLPVLFGRGGPPSAERLGAYLQTIVGYVGGLAQGNLGSNARGRPVNNEMLQAARRTLELLTASTLVALPLGVAWGGLLATVRRGVWGGLLFSLSTLLISLPSFVAVLLLSEAVATITLRTGVRLAFVQGYGLDGHLILPTAVLATRGAAFIARSLQVSQEQIMAQDWIRAARAKGLGGLGLWRRHVLPALRLPLLGAALGAVRVIVAGTIIVDYLYNWGGLGRRLLQVTSGGVEAHLCA